MYKYEPAKATPKLLLTKITLPFLIESFAKGCFAEVKIPFRKKREKKNKEFIFICYAIAFYIFVSKHKQSEFKILIKNVFRNSNRTPHAKRKY